MSKGTQFICATCSKKYSQWVGQCQGCNNWNSLVEEQNYLKASSAEQLEGHAPMPLASVRQSELSRIKTGISEFDLVLGGGLVPASLIALAGNPGVGKSTLLMQVLGELEKEHNVLYFSGEETAEQVKGRATRIGVEGKSILFYQESIWERVKHEVVKNKTNILVIDSIQTLQSSEISSHAGNITQVKEITLQLMKLCKQRGITCFIICHITKDGGMAGPKLLEHMVDCTLYIEENIQSNIKILRAAKNRFGSTDVLEYFKLERKGMQPVDSFISRINMDGSVGCTNSLLKEGRRIFIGEVQALVINNNLGNTKRVFNGVSAKRVSQLIAIIEKYLNLDLSHDDIYVDFLNNKLVNERQLDLGIIVAIVSSKLNLAPPKSTLYTGEIQLSGLIQSTELAVHSLQKLNEEKPIHLYMGARGSEQNAQVIKVPNLRVQYLEKAKDILELMKGKMS